MTDYAIVTWNQFEFGLISEVKKYMWKIHYALNLVTCAVFSDVLPIKF